MTNADNIDAYQLETRDNHAQHLAEVHVREFAMFYATPTTDASGNMMLGWERRIREMPLTTEEANLLLRSQINRVRVAMMENTFPLLNTNIERMAVIFHLCVLMGVDAVKQMTRFWTCMRSEDYEGAGEELLKSVWPRLIGNEEKDKTRALDLLYMLRTGKTRVKGGSTNATRT